MMNMKIDSAWKTFFNWSLSYKLESEFNGYYSRSSHFLWKENKNFDDNQDFTQNKTNFSFAMMSNCGYSHGRIEYLNSLEKYISVDLFGKCGKPCPYETKFKDINFQCHDNLFKKYKFYFAFENSFCKNYVTIFFNVRIFWF